MPAKPMPHAPIAITSAEAGADAPASFDAQIDGYASLFVDPDARGGRRWAAMFDPASCEELDLTSLLHGLPKL